MPAYHLDLRETNGQWQQPARHSHPQSGRLARSGLRPSRDSTGNVAIRTTVQEINTRTSTSTMLAPVPCAP
ncbi:hypothetical protein BDP81DRAFT_427713 [Colletotrichum phormii]|uniref:Uncharacterized protein n=1 Tax=Colletotrichum phormii TaxID=359342 RepID=A0AAI9ZQT7_9PEZI|nr:uncharacterized protein BDP81DRAFT_427713 [Colletotrichum phormii]KAK1636500.1 hypothetical protein BDP81DRAFT_427713 [Colletotrichum phormii]